MAVFKDLIKGLIPPASDSRQPSVMVDYHNPTTGDTYQAPSQGWTAPEGWVQGTLEREEAAEVKPIKTTTPKKEEESLKSFLEEQRVDPSIPTSGQQTYTKIQELGKDKLYDIGKIISEDLNLSMKGANKLEELIINEGTFNTLDPSNIAGLKDLVAKTYEDNVKTISDVQRDEALTQAQTKDTLTQQVEEVKSEGLTAGAEAAKRAKAGEVAALAEEQTSITDVTMEGAEGKAEQVEPITDVEGVTRDVTTIDKTLEAEGPDKLTINDLQTPELKSAFTQATQAGRSVNIIQDPVTGVTRLVDTVTKDLIAEGPSQIAIGEVGEVATRKTATTTAEVAQGSTNEINSNVADVAKQVSTIDTEILGEAAHITEGEINKILDSTAPANYAATIGAITGGTASVVSGSDKVGEAVREITQGEAALDDLDDPKVIAAIAQMPIEALVSSQLETLLEPLENNEIPTWARPAVEKVDAALAARGMGRSSIARDSLFNAIITAATPIAQSNAQTLQLQANKNQDNQQRANELQANLTQDIRMANLTNEQSIRVENLRAMNQSQSEQFTFDAQQELKEYETLINFKVKNADFAQQMTQVNLSNDLQLELANLSALNTADAANMSVENQLRLGKLNQYVNFVANNEQFQQQMELANLDMEGKVEFANLQAKSQADLASMTFEEKKSLTEFQSKVSNGQFNTQLAQALNFKNLDVTTNVALANMQAKNEAFRETFSIDQQEAVLEWQATVDSDKFFQQLGTQIKLANLDMEGKVEFANLSALNEASRDQMNVDQQSALAEYQTKVSNGQFNTQLAQALEFKNLDVTTNVDLAVMAEKNTSFRAQFSTEQQSNLSQWQATVDSDKFFQQLSQDVKLVNLDMEGKVEFANLAALNEASRDQMTVDQQTALAEFQSRVEVGKYNTELAQQMGIANLSNAQQAATFNAQAELNIDLKTLDLNQQVELANSKFLQTMTVTDLSNRQQGAMLNATNMAALDMTDLSNSQQAQVENAKHFLQLDIANLSNSQQAEILNDQWSQQVLLSNVAVENAAKQFASSTENDINKFISTLQSNIELNNKARDDSMEMFNATEKNKALAIEANNDQAIELYNAELYKSLVQFEEQVEFQRESFNASMEYQIDSSNVQWRRNMNTADTAGINAVNQANAINAFNLSSDAMSKLWQETRDNAQWEFLEGEQGKSRQTQLLIATLGNENDQLLKSMGIKADNATAVGTALWELTTSFFEGD